MSEKKIDESWKEKVAQEQKTSTEKVAQEQKTSTEKVAQEQKTSTEKIMNNTPTAAEDVTEQEETFEMPPVDFNLFMSSLGMQALMALGEIENPMNGKKDKQLPQAKYLIDTLEMLQVKTKGNLDPQEASGIEQMLYELRMKYIALSKD